MPEWVTCPSCGLKHTARPDGFCPRCRQSVVAASSSVAVTEPEPAPEAIDPEPPLAMVIDEPAVPSAAKAAGLVLIANGLLQLVATLVMGVSQGPVAFGGLVSVVLDFVVGGYLLAGNEKALMWAKIRVGLGLLILPVIQYVAGGFVLAAFQAAFSVGLLLLLVGTPGVPRLALGVIASGLCLLLQVVGLLAIGAGTNPLTRFVLSAQTDGPAVKTVDGRNYRYRIRTSSDGWFVRKAELARKDNALADVWLIEPRHDAHLLVIAERVGATDRVDMNALANVVLANARKVSSDFTLLDQKPLDNPQGSGRLLHARGKMQGQVMEFYYGLYTREPEVYQLVAFTFERNFDAVEPQLYEWITSFQTGVYEEAAGPSN